MGKKDDKAAQQARMAEARKLVNKSSELFDKVASGEMTPEQAWKALTGSAKHQEN